MKSLEEHTQYVHATQEIDNLAAALGRVQTRVAVVEALMRAGMPDGRLDEERLLLRQQCEAIENAIRARRQGQAQLLCEQRGQSRAVARRHGGAPAGRGGAVRSTAQGAAPLNF